MQQEKNIGLRFLTL